MLLSSLSAPDGKGGEAGGSAMRTTEAKRTPEQPEMAAKC